MKAHEILSEAAIILEERGKLRDTEDGERSMNRAVAAYTSLRGPSMVGELDGWLFMCCLKLARATAGSPCVDDYQDLAGYAALAGECVSNTPADWDIMDDIRAEQKVRETEYTTGKITDVILKFNSEEDCDAARAKMQDEQDWIYRKDYPDNFPSDLLTDDDYIEVKLADGYCSEGYRQEYSWVNGAGDNTIIAFRYI